MPCAVSMPRAMGMPAAPPSVPTYTSHRGGSQRPERMSIAARRSRRPIATHTCQKLGDAIEPKA